MANAIRQVGVHEAKTHLSRLLRAVEAGDEVVVMRAGKPVARIVGAEQTRPVADSYGLFAGQFELGEDFDEESDELADLFGVPREQPAQGSPPPRARVRRRSSQ